MSNDFGGGGRLVAKAQVHGADLMKIVQSIEDPVTRERMVIWILDEMKEQRRAAERVAESERIAAEALREATRSEEKRNQSLARERAEIEQTERAKVAARKLTNALAVTAAAITVLSVLVLAGFLAYIGHAIAGSVLAAVDVVALAGAFLAVTRGRRENDALEEGARAPDALNGQARNALPPHPGDTSQVGSEGQGEHNGSGGQVESVSGSSIS